MGFLYRISAILYPVTGMIIDEIIIYITLYLCLYSLIYQGLTE